MRPYALLYVYRRRLRAHAVQELLAGLGVAAAVALIFAVTVADGSIAGSASAVLHKVIGPASLQLRARGQEGFDARLLGQVEQLPGVKQAAPLLEETASVTGPNGRHVTLDVAGAEVSLTILDGLAHTLPRAVLAEDGMGLTRASANALGITPNDVGAGPSHGVLLKLRGTASSLKVTAVLGAETVGSLSQAVVALMPLSALQQLAGLPGRISRILVQTQPGREAAVRGELQRLAAGRVTVAPADQDVALLRQALRPSDLASGLFAAIAGLLGFLFAFNAILLTVPERRQAIADLRLSGTRRAAIMQMVMFQAMCLGLAASIVGVLLGYALSLGAFHLSTGYLSTAFALGSGTVLGVKPVVLALIGGVLATCLASTVLLLDLRASRALDEVYFHDGVPGSALDGRAQRRLALGAIGLLTVTTAAFVLAPALALPATALLAVATVLAVPLVFAGVLRAAGALTRHVQTLTILPVALTSLKATTLRSLALAATGALALFGAVTLGGARDDLIQGLGNLANAYNAPADVWVLNQGDPLAVNSFLSDGDASRIARVPGVASVTTFQSEFINVGDRRAWMIARPPDANGQLLGSQMVHGNAASAAERLQESGWITVSQELAGEHHVGVGDTLTLPTPTGDVPFRVAATTTNFGWSAGAILMNTADYGRFWGTSVPSALGVSLTPSANLADSYRGIVAAVGHGSGLEVFTAHGRAARFNAIAKEGLGQLQDIATLLIVAAIVAMAAALASAIWQRRPSLAALRLSGTRPSRLRRILLMESALMLGAGCLTGVVAGVYGQVVIVAYLKHVTGYPVSSVAASLRPLEILALVIVVVLVIVAVPSWFASRVSPALALEDE